MTVLYRPVSNHSLARGRLLLQWGSWMVALRCEVLITDLNPRSISAWIFVLIRRLRGRRTLVWGHLYPQDGPHSSTAGLRRMMRALSSGTVLYAYASREPALRDLPGSPVWVAPNSLYTRSFLAEEVDQVERTAIVYVGRLEADKKVDVLVTAFVETEELRSRFTLDIVGHGSALDDLRELARPAGERVRFLGRIYDPVALRDIYHRSLVSVSPGYIGLSLTQSLGFGVPVVVSRDEPHSPELELADLGGVTFFETDDPGQLARALLAVTLDQPAPAVREQWRQHVRDRYSADAMADGLRAAFIGAEAGTHG